MESLISIFIQDLTKKCYSFDEYYKIMSNVEMVL